VEGRSGTTPYAAWAGRLGVLPLLLAALAVPAGRWVAARRRQAAARA
jgi:apolipoprotein N-acyltransferase